MFVDFNSKFVNSCDSFDTKTIKDIVEFLNGLPNDVESYMNGEYNNIVQTLSNLEIINMVDGNINILMSVRSSKDNKNLVYKYNG